MVINSNTLLSGEEYTPLVGYQYQVTKTKRFTMPEPSTGLAEDAHKMLLEFHEKNADEQTYEGQVAIAEFIAGEKIGGDLRETISPVVQVFMLDFFSIGRRITEKLVSYAERSNPSGPTKTT